MDAREFFDSARDGKLVVELAYYKEEHCVGRGPALVIDPDGNIAIMLDDCGDPEETGILAGAIVGFFKHPEAELKIVGRPAYVRPRMAGNRKVS